LIWREVPECPSAAFNGSDQTTGKPLLWRIHHKLGVEVAKQSGVVHTFDWENVAGAEIVRWCRVV
jgi:hypothetical protein